MYNSMSLTTYSLTSGNSPSPWRSRLGIACERTVDALGFFDLQYPGEPRFVHQRFGIRKQDVETEWAQALRNRYKLRLVIVIGATALIGAVRRELCVVGQRCARTLSACARGSFSPVRALASNPRSTISTI